MLPSSFGLHRSIRRLGGYLLDSLTYFDLLVARLEKSNSSTEMKETIPDSLERVLIYAIFCSDRQELESRILDVLPIVTEFDLVVLMNSGTLEYQEPLPAGIVVITRENISRDLGSYRDALLQLNLDVLTELVLVNDSVHWLEGALASFINGARLTHFEITGLTQSQQKNLHIQSFAMHFKLSNNEILNPICSVRNWKLKRTLVAYGERNFSRWWTKNNFRFGPLYSTAKLEADSFDQLSLYGSDGLILKKLSSSKVTLNPSIHYWVGLLLNARIIKKSLLRDNPAKFSNPPKTLSEAREILRTLNSDN